MHRIWILLWLKIAYRFVRVKRYHWNCRWHFTTTCSADNQLNISIAIGQYRWGHRRQCTLFWCNIIARRARQTKKVDHRFHSKIIQSIIEQHTSSLARFSNAKANQLINCKQWDFTFSRMILLDSDTFKFSHWKCLYWFNASFKQDQTTTASVAILIEICNRKIRLLEIDGRCDRNRITVRS